MRTEQGGKEKLEAYPSKNLSTPMKNFLTATGLPLLVVIAASFATMESSNAQALDSRFSRQTPQSIIDTDSATIAAEAKDTSITPSAKANLSSNYGIVRSVSNGTLDVRLLDGTSKQLTISESLAASTSQLKRGDLIGFDTDASGGLTKIQPPEVDKTIEGTVSAIDGNQVTVKTASGESITTPIETGTINRMALAPGSQLKVTTFKDTWATKICGAVTPPPPPVSNVPVETPTPIPIGGATTPPAPKPVTGLW
jgi:hypothetical protein